MAAETKIETVLERAAKLVTPSESEVTKLTHIVSRLEKRISNVLDEESLDVRPELTLGGSYARGTWLRGSHDVDFFLRYPSDLPREKLESEAIRTASISLTGFPVNMRYAEHPYVESFIEGVRINIVPCYSVAPGEWKSAADRSPYHTKYMLSKLDDGLRLEARLVKKFAKAINVYGAEVKVQGFSGYVCEVMTLRFGGFLKVLEGISKVKPAEVISIESFDEDLAATFTSAVVILDPVDTTRNLGSAISTKNVGKFALESRRFSSAPSIGFFTPKKTPVLRKNPLLTSVLVLSFSNEPRSPDILWGELKRSQSSMSDKLERMGFRVLRSAAASDEKRNSALLFFLSALEIEPRLLREGPEYFRADEAAKYYDKNRKKALLTWVGKDGHLESLFQRGQELVKAKSALAWIIAKKNIGAVGVSPRIKNELLEGCKITTADKLLGKRAVPEWLSKGIAQLVTSD